MRIDDPARKLIAGRPAYSLAAFPRFNMYPKGEDIVTLGCMLAVAYNQFEYFEIEVLMVYLPIYMQDYYTDPEKFLWEKFGYVPPEELIVSPKPKQTLQAKLAALGLI